MNRWRVLLAVAVIFLAGAGTGGALVRKFAPKVVKRIDVREPLPVGHQRRQEYIEKLDRELVLSAEQRTKVEDILAASQKRMKEIWEPLEPQVKEEYKRSRREISEVLTPEQQAKMKSWRKDRDERKGGEKKGDEKNLLEEKAGTQRKCSKDDCCL